MVDDSRTFVPLVSLENDCFVTNLMTVDTSLKIWPMKWHLVWCQI